MAASTVTPRAVPTSFVHQMIARHPVAAFLVLAYGLSWLIYIPPFLSTSGIGLLPVELSVLPFNLLATVFGLTLSAYLVTRVTGGREGVRALRCRYTHWRVGIGWHLLAIFALPLLSLLGASLWLGPGPLAAFAGQWDLLFSVFLVNALVNVVLINLWEEGAWMGFLLPRLQARWGPLASSALVGAAMALFHVPLIFIVGGVSDQRVSPDRYWFYIVFLFGLTPVVRVLMTWLWNSTRGSVIVVALFHGAYNTTNGEKFTPVFVPGDTLWVYGVYAALALIVVVLTRGRLAYRSESATEPVLASRPIEEAPSRA